VLGAYYLQTCGITVFPFVASLVLGFLVLAIALANEIPDYHADKLVGKKNLVVRSGRKKATILCALTLFTSFVILSVGVGLGVIPLFSLSTFAVLPLACWSLSIACRNYNRPRGFTPAIRGIMLVYVIASCVLVLGYLI
jgi:1,4-dihydroxy-2-naphthoate octaprenyltransferase